MKELADFSRHQVEGQLLRPGLAKLHALTAHWGKDVFFVGGNLLHLQYVVQRCTKYFYVFLFLLRIVSRTWPSYWESAFFFQSALFFLGVFFIKRETACFKLLFLKLSGRLPGEVLSLPSEFYGWHSALVPKFGRWGFPGGGRESSKKKNTTRVQGEINSVFLALH